MRMKNDTRYVTIDITDSWDSYEHVAISESWEPSFMTIIVIRVTLDSIRNSCNVCSIRMWNVALAEEFPYLRSMAKEVFVHMSPVETLHTNIYLDRIIIVRLVWGLKNVGSGAQTFLPHSLSGPPPLKALNWENRLECIRQSHRPTPTTRRGGWDVVQRNSAPDSG